MRVSSFPRSGCARNSPSPEVEPLEPRQLLAVYYLSPAGSDAWSGQSTTRPWKTLSRANLVNFAAGDSILLQGGATFTGKLYFDSLDKGSPAAPITVSTYGAGRATIANSTDTALYAYNTAGIKISGLTFRGPVSTTAPNSGIFFYVDQLNTRKEFIRVDNVDVYGFKYGIAIGGGNGTAGFRDVHITKSYLHHNSRSGLFTFGATRNCNEKIYINRTFSYENTGVPSDPGVTGHGLLLGSVNGATVERSLAYNNGLLGNGGAGIWCYDSNKVLFQFNESHHNRTGGPHDGDGFDFDQNVSNSVMQYNYSHDNDGAGYLMATKFSNTLHTNNTLRYNISQNDCRKLDMGALHIWGKVLNSQWYNNTVYLTPRPGSTASRYAIKIHNNGIPTNDLASAHFRNNILQTTGGMPLLLVTTDQVNGMSDLKLQSNAWYSTGSTFRINYNGTTFNSLTAFRTATSHETLNGARVGYQGDPRLTSPGLGPSFNNPDKLITLASYKLQSTSPLVNTALTLSTFGLNPGTRDFWGTSIPQATRFDFGADELG